MSKYWQVFYFDLSKALNVVVVCASCKPVSLIGFPSQFKYIDAIEIRSKEVSDGGSK